MDSLVGFIAICLTFMAAGFGLGFMSGKGVCETTGKEWNDCYSNKTCDAKLTCIDNHCVPLGDLGSK